MYIIGCLKKTEYKAQIGPYGIAVYCAFARHADNKTQQAYPSFNTIARETGISRSKVIATVRQLEVIGLLKCQPRYNQETKGQSSNLITLLGERHVQNDAVAKRGQSRTSGRSRQRASDTSEGNPKRKLMEFEAVVKEPHWVVHRIYGG